MIKYEKNFLFIEKKPFLVSILFAFFLLTLGGCKKDFSQNEADSKASSDRNSINKPNIILFVADDLGYEVPRFTGGQSYSTPTLDFIASEGAHFNHTYSYPDGYPSRLALLTGKYNFRNYKTWGLLPDGENTLGNLLQDAGYATCYVGKWQSGGGDQRITSA